MIPPDHVVAHALEVARLSPCRSKRGVVLWEPRSGAFRGHGFNGPPALASCPGREVCAGNCSQRSVHAETRAIRDALVYRREDPADCYELLHVELAPVLTLNPDGPVRSRIDRQADVIEWFIPARVGDMVVACDGPSCAMCAALIADVGFIAGV